MQTLHSIFKLFIFCDFHSKKLFFLLLIVLLTLPSFAQDKGTSNMEFVKEEDRKDWNFKISPYAWLAGMSTNVGGEKITQSFNDLSSITNFGFQIAALAQYKKWSLSSNFTIAKLGANEILGPIKVDLEINQIILDTKLGYLLIDKVDESDDIIRGWAMEATLGAIYWFNGIDVKVDYDFDFPGLPTHIDQDQKWVDLVIGTNFRIILSKSVYLGLSVDVGGFGIGDSSKLYWDLIYVNTFKVSKLLTVTAGYKTFNYKRVDGTGADELKTNVKTFGPLLGVSIHL